MRILLIQLRRAVIPSCRMQAPYMTGASANGVVNGYSTNGSSHTITALKRWSCDDKDLPPIPQVKAIHVYDFDNTLFASPLPNSQLWNTMTLSHLQGSSAFMNGGWWHDAAILACTGEGVEKEEPRAWEGWWNEQIVQLVELTMQQKDALCILLTGRSESGFAELIKRMVRSKGLSFDMTCLKPAAGPENQTFSSTMVFKQALLKDLVYTYREAEEIRVYEDRPKHTKAFRDFFTSFNQALLSPNPPIPRKTIVAEVIQVTEKATTLDPTTETAEVQRMINVHNAAIRARTAPPGLIPFQIKRSVFYTAYLIDASDTEKLASLVEIPPGMSKDSIRFHANNIIITPRPCPNQVMRKVGGIGKKLSWRVIGMAFFERRIWAARVEPIPANAEYHTDNPAPLVVLALTRGSRPGDAKEIRNWQPVPQDKSFEFETTVGEKALLRIEEERPEEPEYQASTNIPQKRAFANDENFISLDEPTGFGRQPQHPYAQRFSTPIDKRAGLSGNNSGSYRGGNQNRGNRRDGSGYRGRDQGGRGGRGGSNRGGGGNNNRGRGRGGNHSQYRSLDDMPAGGQQGGGGAAYYDEY